MGSQSLLQYVFKQKEGNGHGDDAGTNIQHKGSLTVNGIGRVNKNTVG
jgi:hypothetical protein